MPWRIFQIGSSHRVTVPEGATTLYLDSLTHLMLTTFLDITMITWDLWR